MAPYMALLKGMTREQKQIVVTFITGAMKRIFLDTNILIDYIDNREGADDAEQIFACGFSGEALLCASALTFANIAYIIKGRTQEEKYDALSQLANVVEIIDLRKQEVMAAIAQPVKDFEDIKRA